MKKEIKGIYGIDPMVHVELVRSLRLDRIQKGKGFLLVASFVTTGITKILHSPVLKKDFISQIENGKLNNFKDKYGSHWVSEAILGGTFFGLVIINTQQQQFYDQNTNNFSTNPTALRRFLEEKEVEVKIKCQGAPLPKLVNVCSVEGLHDIMNEFLGYLTNNQEAGYPISYRCSPIETIPEISENLTNIQYS